VRGEDGAPPIYQEEAGVSQSLTQEVDKVTTVFCNAFPKRLAFLCMGYNNQGVVEW
jgi:hypothetical protein